MSHISWNEYFMEVALLTSKRSKDPSTKVGACIVDLENRIVSTGYNGFPKLLPKYNNDLVLPWNKESNNVLETKYPYVIHAESNAILNAYRSVRNCTIYVTLFPCAECSKLIIQSGISTVVYLNTTDTDRYKDSFTASKTMFELSGVRCFQYDPEKII
ncbi:ComEB Deoxycytidylate deaminase [uncultured Caudovirales phage]|uniref:ComEB Deoxycytidylate deaminase n=1 Tax=uncultured Caudovirales phage TaxID=2100421 RepID=A0A6J5M7W4_9CAUD|nr:ComEB Deoxycytidylate deaminase [uncultured Caudovirales phage]